MSKQLLQVGDIAPQLTAKDVYGNEIVTPAADERFTLLVFLRYAGCPWCNLAIHRLSVEYPLLKRDGCDVVAFVQSPADSVKKNIYGRHNLHPPFPIIPDASRKYYDAYGVHNSVVAAARSIIKVPYWLRAAFQHGYRQTELDGDLFLVPALFLVNNRTGSIVKSEYGKSFYDHDTFTGIYEPLVFDRL